MNFKTYLAILQDEGLEENPLADGALIQAMKLQEQIKSYSAYMEVEEVKAEVKRMEERKIKYIWDAIDLARANPPGSDMHKLALRAFQKRNKREYKGFLNEYRIMKSKKKGRARSDVLPKTNLTPAEKRVKDRWEQVMEKVKG